jgi:hypothetical protein
VVFEGTHCHCHIFFRLNFYSAQILHRLINEIDKFNVEDFILPFTSAALSQIVSVFFSATSLAADKCVE